MCDCLQKLAEFHSEKNIQNGKPACVQATVRGEIRIVTWVKDTRPGIRRQGDLKRSSKSKYAGIPFRFCPVCGTRSDVQQQAKVWGD